MYRANDTHKRLNTETPLIKQQKNLQKNTRHNGTHDSQKIQLTIQTVRQSAGLSDDSNTRTAGPREARQTERAMATSPAAI